MREDSTGVMLFVPDVGFTFLQVINLQAVVKNLDLQKPHCSQIVG